MRADYKQEREVNKVKADSVRVLTLKKFTIGKNSAEIQRILLFRLHVFIQRCIAAGWSIPRLVGTRPGSKGPDARSPHICGKPIRIPF